MSANDDKRIQSIDCKEEYAFEASENILPGHEKTINVKKELKSPKMSSFDDVTEENRKESSPKWPHIFDYPYRITIMAGGVWIRTNKHLTSFNKPSTRYG